MPLDHERAKKVNPAILNNPKYAYLFKQHTDSEIWWKVQSPMGLWWATSWAVIVGCWLGLYPWPVMTLGFIVCFLRWGYAIHEGMHGHVGLSENVNALPLCLHNCMPFFGFNPFAICYRDLAWLHVREHHKVVKSIMDHDTGDWDTYWSSRPLWWTSLLLFVQPSHFSIPEVLWQWWHCPASHWPYRLMNQVVMMGQWFVAYKMGLLLPCICMGHLGSYLLIFLFHGLTHRQSYYEVMMADPSGKRLVPWIDPIVNALVGAGMWADMKFHDIHHAFATVTAFGTISFQCRFHPWEKVRDDCADMVDVGLFVDDGGTVFNHLEPVGYKLGSRAQHFADNEKRK